MNARLMKEARDLLPAFVSMLTLIVLLYIFMAVELGLVVLAFACVIMAGSSFGSEFQYRTFSLLLSQPVSRSAIWREKMLVLGAGMLALVAPLAVCLAVRGVAYHLGWMLEFGNHWDSRETLALFLIPLCAFCGAPCWTLWLRHELGGMVFAVGAPIMIMVGDNVVRDRLGYDSAVFFAERNRSGRYSALG